MTLRLYNTLTRTKEEFRPLDPKNVRMYVCGPTVYDHAHIGNARPVIVFDVLFRLLRHIYGSEHVTYVRNVTDVDDKINARAREEGVSIRALTDRTLEQFHQDIAALGVLPPTHEPRATESIPEMIAIIERLIARGHAYVAQGHVLFDVTSIKPYGRLSRRSLDDMIAGARVDVAPYKKGEMDFVLWKPSDAATPGWDSPWGRGRPGWHIECSAMSWKFLGEVFDIHGGGIDLVFPHHENELAQTCSAFGIPKMANVWMHNGFLQVEGQKMSKSLGNFVTINELLMRWPGDVLRLQMLMTHYRQPIDWTADRCEEAREELFEWANVLAGHGGLPADPSGITPVAEALENDLNTHESLTVLRGLFSEARVGRQSSKLRFLAACKFLGFSKVDKPGLFDMGVTGTNVGDARLLDHLENVVRIRAAMANNWPDAATSSKADIQASGLEVQISDADGYLTLVGTDVEFSQRVKGSVEARLEARKSKNWAESDRIRDELAAMGVVLKDNKDGTTTWEVKR